MEERWISFSSMKQAIMLFSSKEQYGYAKIGPIRAEGDTYQLLLVLGHY
jgi:hypothetical protein